jgi:drug/metabolite transporter (DMT)-like permease
MKVTILSDLPIIAAFSATALWLVSNILSKKVSVSLGFITMSAIVLPLGMLPMAIGIAVVGVHAIPIYSIVIAALAGIFLTLGFLLLYKTLETEQLTNTVALGELQPAILVLFGIFALGESVNMIQAVSMMIIFAGAVLVVTVEGLSINKKLIPACFAMLSWALYWVLITYSVHASGSTFSMPVLVSRITGSAIAIAYFAANKGKVMKYMHSAFSGRRRRELGIIVAFVSIIAIVDASGDFIFAYVTASNALAIGSALTALSPIAASIAGFFIYKDRLTAPQLAGFAIMVVGALSLAIL